jgi:hypothetical protein
LRPGNSRLDQERILCCKVVRPDLVVELIGQ